MKTVAIVGSHPDTKGDAPFEDKSIPIWIFNEAGSGKWCERCDAVFQMHIPELYRSTQNRVDAKHFEWLQNTKATVYMQDVDPDIPTSVRYPLQEIADKYLGGNKFFLSSIDYALALALYQGYKCILIYGIEMASNTEYHYQRQGTRVWLSIAHALGVQVETFGKLNVYDRPCYGYEGIITQDPEDLQKRVRELVHQVDDQREKVFSAERRLGKSYNTDSNIPKKIAELVDATNTFGILEGQLAEFKRYAQKAEKMLADGGVAYLDRNELEMAAGMAVPKVEENKSMIWRTAGRLDVGLYAWEQTHNPQALANVKVHTKEHIDAAFAAGYAEGSFMANHELAANLDKAIAAAGGQRAVDLLMVDKKVEI
jgi:hypothetical protein